MSLAQATENGARGARRAVPRWRHFIWQHPEWWALAASLGAWLILIFPRGIAATASLCLAPLPLMARSYGDLAVALFAAGTLHAIGHWLLMVAAMMLPLAIFPLRHVAFRSLWRRRHRAIGGFLIGYVAVWTAAGVGFIALRSALPSSVHDAGIAAAAFVLAALWQLAPMKQRALLACHRTVPLAPKGWRADLACLRYGALQGRSCVANCWLAMAAAMLAANLAVMALIGAVLVAERYRPRTARLAVAALLALAAVWVAIER